jgi:hypothetical protein
MEGDLFGGNFIMTATTKKPSGAKLEWVYTQTTIYLDGGKSVNNQSFIFANLIQQK